MYFCPSLPQQWFAPIRAGSSLASPSPGDSWIMLLVPECHWAWCFSLLVLPDSTKQSWWEWERASPWELQRGAPSSHSTACWVKRSVAEVSTSSCKSQPSITLDVILWPPQYSNPPQGLLSSLVSPTTLCKLGNIHNGVITYKQVKVRFRVKLSWKLWEERLQLQNPSRCRKLSFLFTKCFLIRKKLSS